MKRFFCAILVVFLFASAVMPVMAANEQSISPRYTYIQGLGSSLSIGKLGLSSCGANCVAYGGDTIKLTMVLQRYNGSSWTTIKTWVEETSTSGIALNKNYAVTKGYTYRVRATCSVYNASGTLVESGYIYSNQVVY